MGVHPLIYALRLLAFEAPEIVLYVAGVIAACAYRNRNPRAACMVLAGCGMLLGVTTSGAVASAYWARAKVQQNSELGPWMPALLGMASSFLHAAALGLIISAAFVRRASPSTETLVATNIRRPWRWPRYGLALAALLTYGISMLLPAVSESGGQLGGSRVWLGWEALLEPLGLNYAAWRANPLFLIGIVLLLSGYVVPAGICGMASVLFSLSYCLMVLNDFEYHSQPVRIGYWVWTSAMFILATAPILRVLERRHLNRQASRGLCIVCGYDLRATPELCPECGTRPRTKP